MLYGSVLLHCIDLTFNSITPSVYKQLLMEFTRLLFNANKIPQNLDL
jgi:hypothetical protein